MNGEYTPGPWSADHRGVIVGGNGFLTSVAETYASRWAHCQAVQAAEYSQSAADFCGTQYREAIANAHLIAAAPELLQVCLRMCEYWDQGTPVHPGALITHDVLAAIAKATSVEG